MIQKAILPLAAIACLALVLSGCKPSCDSIPTESLASVRILNAVSNSNLLLVYVDGKLFDSCWYDVATQYASVNPRHVFGYRSTYLPDGAPLRAGLHHVAAVDAASRDTVSTWDGVLHDYRQSLIILGKMNGSEAQAPRTIYLNDIVKAPDPNHSFARFVDAVPDIGGIEAQGLDVYFATSPKTLNGKAKPDLRIHFDSISDAQGTDNGTGLSANDYVEFPAIVPGLLIMPVGDTVLDDAILNVPYPLPTTGFLATIVIRGETQPVDNDPIASTLVLEDGNQGPGTASFDIESFLVRLVNASRYTNLSLLIKGPADDSGRAGIPAGAGQAVLNLGADSVGEYIPLNPDFDESSDYWFSTTNFDYDSVFHFHRVEVANERSTFIAIDTIPNNTGTPHVSLIILTDTVSNPDNPAMGRVRFVNTSPDYVATFTFAGKPFAMKQGAILYADTAGGNYSFQVSGAPTTGTVNLTVSPTRPTTVFFMPSSPGNPVPYKISTE